MASRIELVLDRFIVWGGGGRAVDLATGDLVWLRVMAPHGGVDGLRRAQAAARVSALRIQGMAALVDFGLDGLAGWVEAYRPAASGADAATIVALLARAGCAVKEPARPAGQDPPMEGQFVPAPLDLVTIDEPAATAPPAAAAASGPALGILLERRDELDAIAEAIAGQAEAGARIVRIGAPPGAGLRTLFAAMAREARLAGFVPVSSVFCGDSPGLPGRPRRPSCSARRFAIVTSSSSTRPRTPRGRRTAAASRDSCRASTRPEAARTPWCAGGSRCPATPRSPSGPCGPSNSAAPCCAPASMRTAWRRPSMRRFGGPEAGRDRLRRS